MKESPDGKALMDLTEEVQQFNIKMMLHLLFGEDIAHIEIEFEEKGNKK